MNRFFIPILAGFLGFSVTSRATTVTFAAGPGSRSVVDANSTAVSTSALVWAGTFSSEAFTFNPSLSISANVANIEAAGGWHQFGLSPSTGSPEATGGIINYSLTTVFSNSKVTGTVEDDTTGSPTTTADFFNNKQIYLWIFNGSTVANSTQMGIFDATTNANPLWIFPINTGGGTDNTQLSTASASGAPTMNAIGGAGSVTSSNLILAASVPEPSTLVTLAGAAGFIGLLRRRRPTQR